MLIFLLSLSISLIFTAPILSTPLLLGLWILLYSLLISALTAISTSSWFGLILFIIYIGGILVIFAYFAALSPNQTYISPILSLTLPTSIIIFFMYLNRTKIHLFTPSHIFLSYTKINTIIYTQEQAPILVFLVILLLLALILVVKITKHTRGPLRPFHN